MSSQAFQATIDHESSQCGLSRQTGFDIQVKPVLYQVVDAVFGKDPEQKREAQTFLAAWRRLCSKLQPIQQLPTQMADALFDFYSEINQAETWRTVYRWILARATDFRLQYTTVALDRVKSNLSMPVPDGSGSFRRVCPNTTSLHTSGIDDLDDLKSRVLTSRKASSYNESVEDSLYEGSLRMQDRAGMVNVKLQEEAAPWLG